MAHVSLGSLLILLVLERRFLLLSICDYLFSQLVLISECRFNGPAKG